jgi:hypothetical protein
MEREADGSIFRHSSDSTQSTGVSHRYTSWGVGRDSSDRAFLCEAASLFLGTRKPYAEKLITGPVGSKSETTGTHFVAGQKD